MRYRFRSSRCSGWPRWPNLLLSVAAIGLLASGAVRADYCDGRVEAALTALVDESATPIDRAERARMQTVLMGLCADAVQAGGGNAPPAAPVALAQPPAGVENPGEPQAAASAEPAEAQEGDEKGVRIFGIEFEKADPDSAGHERLRTKR